ncbi:hypothetical protein IWZ00DRAFT_112262 [Phyllosticta capitalensis]
MPDSATNDNNQTAHNLQTLLLNVESVSSSASAVGRECRHFMGLLQQVLAGPGAREFMDEMGESLKRLVDAFDGYSSAVTDHSVAFAVAAEDAKRKIDVLKEGGRQGQQSVTESSSSSIPRAKKPVVKLPALRIRTADTHPSSPCAFPSEAPLNAPTHLPPPQAPSTVYYTPESRSRSVSPDPDCDPRKMQVSRTISPDLNCDSQNTQDVDGAVSTLQEDFRQVRLSSAQGQLESSTNPEREPRPSLALSLPKADFTFRAPPSSSGSSSPSTNRSPASPQRNPFLTPPLPSPSTAPSSPSSPTRPSFHNLPYTVVSRGVNARGNRWEKRDYGPGAPNRNAYHYSNSDGSYFYSNWDGSRFWRGKNGKSWVREGEMGWRRHQV